MESAEARFQSLAAWTKNAKLWAIEPGDCVGPTALKQAGTALIVGLGISAVIQGTGLFVQFPTMRSGELFGLPVLAVLPLLQILVFIVVLCATARVMVGRPVDYSAVTALAMFGWAVILPVITALTAEQFYAAVSLFKAYRDPSIPYLQAATHQLLQEEADMFAVTRLWVFLALEVVVNVVFVYSLARVLSRIVKARRLLESFAAVGVALLAQYFAHRYYFGRAFWTIVGAMVEP